ncbi:transposase [Spirosoma agri]|nr:transposase [Spirosoma agri]
MAVAQLRLCTKSLNGLSFISSSLQGRKRDPQKLLTHFQLSSRIPKDNFYHRLKDTLHLAFLYEHTKVCYRSTGNPSIDSVVFFKFMLISYLQNITSDRKLVEHCATQSWFLTSPQT